MSILHAAQGCTGWPHAPSGPALHSSAPARFQLRLPQEMTPLHQSTWVPTLEAAASHRLALLLTPFHLDGVDTVAPQGPWTEIHQPRRGECPPPTLACTRVCSQWGRTAPAARDSSLSPNSHPPCECFHRMVTPCTVCPTLNYSEPFHTINSGVGNHGQPHSSPFLTQWETTTKSKQHRQQRWGCRQREPQGSCCEWGSRTADRCHQQRRECCPLRLPQHPG